MSVSRTSQLLLVRELAQHLRELALELRDLLLEGGEVRGDRAHLGELALELELVRAQAVELLGCRPVDTEVVAADDQRAMPARMIAARAARELGDLVEPGLELR